MTEQEITEFTDKLRKDGHVFVFGIVPPERKGIYIHAHRTQRDIVMILNAILLNITELTGSKNDLVELIMDFYIYFKTGKSSDEIEEKIYNKVIKDYEKEKKRKEKEEAKKRQF